MFIDVELLSVVDGSLLYQISKRVQVGLTVWVDTKCVDNFNGFVEIGRYLGWMREVLDGYSFGVIEKRVYPSAGQVELFESYGDIVMAWRVRNNRI